jgi:cytochrome c oxidase assembly protein subunit 11
MTTGVQVQTRHRRTLYLLAAVSIGMFGFGFAMVPLYGLLCKAVGTPTVSQDLARGPDAQAVGGKVQDRWVTVKFDTTVNPNLPWIFKPLKEQVRVHPGALNKVMFIATNRSSGAVTGQALYNIAPWQATAYFHKLECFCFTQQTLEGDETRKMPLIFVVSTDLPQGVRSLTLSYSFLRIPEKYVIKHQGGKRETSVAAATP